MKSKSATTKRIISALGCVSLLIAAPTVALGQQYDNGSYNDRDRQQAEMDRNQSQSGNRDENRADRADNQPQLNEYGNRQSDQLNRFNDNDEPAGLGVLVAIQRGQIEVMNVAPNSPAEEAGIHVGDVVLAVNGRDITDPRQFTQFIRQEQPGTQVDIRVQRNGMQMVLTANLESRGDVMSMQDRQRMEDERYYANSPPWGQDDLLQQVNILEQQVRRLQNEIDDMRQMLESNPNSSQFSSTNRDQRANDRRRNSNYNQDRNYNDNERQNTSRNRSFND